MKCPAGHESVATDYCDTCGEAMPGPPEAATDSGPEAEPVAASEAATEPAPEPAPESGAGTCPNCGAATSPDALFCEACGYDYTTGSMPRRTEVPAVAGVPADQSATSPTPELDQPWVAEVWIDPAWYANQASPDPIPSPGPPTVVALRRTSLLIGRTSVSRGIDPDIDCGNDNGISRRHAQLTTDGTRWWIEDLASANGTFVGDSVSGIPSVAITVGRKRELGADERVYLGSWTRLVVRAADEGELDSL